jgi:hypothetical protein
MASSNANAAYGFRAINNPNSDNITVRARIGSTGIALPTGAIAYLRTDGKVGIWDGTFTNGARQLLGEIMAGVRSADTVRTVYVAENADQHYEVMLSAGTVTGINAAYGRCFAGSLMKTSNGTLNQSVAKLNDATGTSVPSPVAGSAVPFQIIRYSGEVGNAISQSFARVIVRIHPLYHIFGSSVKTV